MEYLESGIDTPRKGGIRCSTWRRYSLIRAYLSRGLRSTRRQVQRDNSELVLKHRTGDSFT